MRMRNPSGIHVVYLASTFSLRFFGFALFYRATASAAAAANNNNTELELELIQTQMTQKPMLRAEVGMRVRCAKQASIE